VSSTSDAHTAFRLELLLDHRVIHWSVSSAWIAVVAWKATSNAGHISKDALSLVPWILLLMTVHLLPVTGWRSAQLVADWPIQTAAALVLPPIEAGIVAFLASIDPRELRRSVPFGKALFNRSQIALISLIGATVVHALSRTPTNPFQALPLAVSYLAVTVLLNYMLIGAVMSREQSVPLPEALKRLRPGLASDFALTFVAWAVLGAMIAVVFTHVGWPTLLAVLGPTLLGRQILSRSQMVIDTTKAYESKNRTIARLETQIFEERSDERRLIAADLHDEVLQPLFKVTLMAHVLKADLASGRLLEIDADLPELLSAAEDASTTLRELIGDLRRSALGSGGLPAALNRLVETVRRQGRLEVGVEIHNVDPEPMTQLVLYQVAKEALGNVLTHARATKVELKLTEDSDHWLLEISDDGVGFDSSAENPGHYGIAIMRERAAALGGHFFLDSAPRLGCRIRTMLPKQP
jgi:signal transduction histidine kinase